MSLPSVEKCWRGPRFAELDRLIRAAGPDQPDEEDLPRFRARRGRPPGAKATGSHRERLEAVAAQMRAFYGAQNQGREAWKSRKANAKAKNET